MRPELEYFIAMVRSYVERRSAPTPPAGLDWHVLGGFVFGHRLTTALAPPAVNELPESLREEWDRVARDLRRRTAILMLELPALLAQLEAAGCRPLVLKGGGLGYTIYDGSSDRFLSDIDLLVERSRVEQALDALEQVGYAATQTRRQQRFYDVHHFHRILTGRSGIPVEVHWDLSRPSDYFRFDLAGLRERSERITVNGGSFAVPAPGDQLLHAATQCVDEGFTNIWRVIDGARLLRAGGIERDELAVRADRQGMLGVLWVLLRVIDVITGVRDEELESRVAPRGTRRRALESLDPAGKLLSGFASRHAGHRRLMEWLCAPNGATARRHALRFVFPGEAQFLAWGYERVPGRMRRTLVGIGQLWSLVKIAGYHGWCMVTHRR